MAWTDTPLVAARRRRLREWIRDHHGGSRKAFLEAARLRGFELNPTEVSNLQSGRKSFGENKAAEYEQAGGMPEGYLTAPLLTPSQVPRLYAGTIRRAVQLLREESAKYAGSPVSVEDDPELFAEMLRLALLEEAEGGVREEGSGGADRPSSRASGAEDAITTREDGRPAAGGRGRKSVA